MKYRSRDELVSKIRSNYTLFIREFKDIDEEFKDTKVETVLRSPTEILAYQLGWINLLISWDKRERLGETVKTPHADYEWDQLGLLYQTFFQEYSHLSLTELTSQLDELVDTLIIWIGTLTDEELFKQGTLKWTGDKYKWPVSRFIHMNSVAPFKSFKEMICKWKKSRRIALNKELELEIVDNKD